MENMDVKMELDHLPMSPSSSLSDSLSEESEGNAEGPTDTSVEQSVSLNQQYQMQIKHTMSTVQSILEHNWEEQQKSIEEQSKNMLYNGYIYKTNRKPITLFAAPYFQGTRGAIAPDNDDAITKRKRNDVDAYLQQPRPWIAQEHVQLAKSVYENALKVQLRPLGNREAYLTEKLATEELSKKKAENVKQMISRIQQEIKSLRMIPKSQLFEESTDSIDWLTVSSVNMCGTRSPEECECMWTNYLNPKVNRQKFQPSEDKKLKKLALKHKERDWDMIAKELKTNRTAIQCLQRYQSHLNDNILNKFWTREEDRRLCDVIDACRVGEYIPWHYVSYYMIGRSRTQVLNRWNRHIKPESRSGRWSKEEDAVLLAARMKYGPNWTKITEFLPGRTNYSCRERYLNCLTPALIAGSWSLDEDRTLVRLYAEYGARKWSKINAYFDGRTCKACFQRIKSMKDKNPDALIKALEQCKSGLGDEPDFMPEPIIPTRDYPAVNERRQHLRNRAEETLKSALVKLNVMQPDEEVVPYENFTTVVLKQVSDELLVDQDYDSTRKSITYHMLEQFLEREKILDEGRRSPTPSTAEEEAGSDSSSESDVSPEEEEKLNQQLDELFQPRVAAGTQPIKKHYIYRSQKHCVEYDALKYLIFKAFNVKHNEKPDTNFDGVDFNLSVARILDMFVLPTSEEGPLPVIPPNVSTLSGLLLLFATRRLVESTATGDIPPRAVANFKLIASDQPGVLKCQACQNKTEESTETSECECALLHNMRSQFLLLRERFLTVFLWPALLSGSPMSEKQFDKLIASDPLGIRDLPNIAKRTRGPDGKIIIVKRLKKENNSESEDNDVKFELD